MALNSIPITERSNPKSEDIDLISPLEITKVLTKCEAEIFGGYKGSKGFYDPGFLNRCSFFSVSIKDEIQKSGKVDLVLLGAGTSGRLCRLLAKTLQDDVKSKINIIPVIAGGIKALVRAQPNTEDKKEEGQKDYLSYTSQLDRSKCFVVGVTCGLSANYVKGALDEANKYSKDKTAIIGFNPIDLATVELGDSIKLLNPIIGPEPIMGSVRMKGGTATMILIYSLIMSSLSDSFDIEKSIKNLFRECQMTLSLVNKYQNQMAQMIEVSGKSLRKGGSIYLAGSTNYGPLCIYDAAECPPTFGARVNQVNGYTGGGIFDLVYFSGEEAEQMAKEIRLEVFVKDVFPGLTKNDSIITISEENEDSDMFTEITTADKKNVYSLKILNANSVSVNSERVIAISEDWKNHFSKLLFVRSLLIQLSTGSFVLIGKVYKNKMIDLRITNKKLFLRAIRVVNQITDMNEKDIEKALLKIIYESDSIPHNNTLENHIDISAAKESVVPLTILALIYPKKEISELKIMLEKEPIVRKLVVDELEKLKEGKK